MVQYKFVLVFFVFSLKRVCDIILTSFWSYVKNILSEINGVCYSRIIKCYIQTNKFPVKRIIAIPCSGCLHMFSPHMNHKNKDFTLTHHISNLDSMAHFSF